MKYFLLLMIVLVSEKPINAQSTIYSFTVDSVSGTGAINFSDFQGKKILIVEAASGDSTFSQLRDLQLLSEVYQDSLVIVVFPTNSFGSEPLDSGQLALAYSNTIGGKLVVGTKINVSGTDVHPLYQWLSSGAANGVVDVTVITPFKKILIGRDGKIAGVYTSKVNPMDTILFDAVRTSQ